MLQFDALLVAGSSWSGLLQDHASDARAFCAALVCDTAFRTHLSMVAVLTTFDESHERRFIRVQHRGAFPRSAHRLLSGSPPSSHLVSPPVGSRLKAFVCSGIGVLAGGRICEITTVNPSSSEECAWSCFSSRLLAHRLRERQGSAPETAPPLFPGGGLISYNSIFTTRGLMPESAGSIPPTARPTFSHEGDFNFTWGFYRNFDLTILVPIVTNHFDSTNEPTVGGTGFGDAMVLVKYRFYRRDSQRGTTQASVTFGPKIPTGRTDLTDGNGGLLPASLQPGRVLPISL